MSQSTETMFPSIPAFNDTFEFGGIEVPFDSSEYETMQRFEAGVARMREYEKDVKKDVSLSERTLSFCKMYEQLIDGLFGEGTFLKMCGGKYSMHLANTLYYKLIDTISSQTAANEAIKVGTAAKYLPNRAARRAANKK